MKPISIALMVYGDVDSTRDALSEEKYSDLAKAFSSEGFPVKSVLYNDEIGESLYNYLSDFEAVLVWVNPLEQNRDRRKLDSILVKVAETGCLVSTHPEIILKIGTKDILFKTRDMGWGSDTRLYSTHEEFVKLFPTSLSESGVKVLKQYRGNGGNGVFRISAGKSNHEVILQSARGDEIKILSWSDFYDEIRPYFLNEGFLIEQEWNNHLTNGMVRCYLCGNKVAGFGYQEINMMYEIGTLEGTVRLPPSKRYYFTENCGLFSDLKEIMENSWVPELQQRESITNEMLPIIWDADFFIDINKNASAGKYTLCEINVSCVSPFPPSAIKFIVKEVGKRVRVNLRDC